MNKETICRICAQNNLPKPESIKRCAVGIANYVYIVKCGGEKYTVRMNREQDAYCDTIYWLEKLNDAGVPMPHVIGHGRSDGFEYLILSYIEGGVLANVHSSLGIDDKREIARQFAAYQRLCSQMSIPTKSTKSNRSLTGEQIRAT